MTQLARIPRIVTSLLLLIAVFSAVGRAGTWVAFQNSFTRGTGAPITVTNTFTLLNPNTQYTLKAYNGGLQNTSTELVSSSVVYLNGVQVIGPANFNQNVAEVNVTIFPGLTNTLSVQVRGQPGGLLTIEVIGVDNDPPTITASLSPSPNAAGWNNSPVTVTFTCSDKTSGVASCPSPVTVSTEGANQVVSGTATDSAGNTASTSVTVRLDMTPPTITGSFNPPPDAGGYNSGPVTVTFTCTDALSGVASCSPPVSVMQEGTTPVTGTTTDVAGNTGSTTITVNVSLSYFKIRSWQTNPAGDPSQTGKCLDYGTSPSGNGATVFLNDCANAHLIRVAEIGDQTDAQGFVRHHDVVLFAGSLVIGIHNPPANTQGGLSPAPSAQSEYPLELQTYNPILATTLNQIFALDGDSIILESSRPCISTDTNVCPAPPPQLVIQIQNARGANGSPIVAAVRNLSDNEFWDFFPQPGSRPYPTGGFISPACSPPVPITTADALVCALSNATWGSVILVSSPNGCRVTDTATGQILDIGGCIDLSNHPSISLPAGVTLRGNRRGTLSGPQLYFSYRESGLSSTPSGCNSDACMLRVHGDYVRVTGLRLRGESRDPGTSEAKTIAVQVDYPGATQNPPAPLPDLTTVTHFIATIDHNDGSDWGESPVESLPVFNYHFNNLSNACTYNAYGLGYTCDENVQTETVLYPVSYAPPSLPNCTSGGCKYANNPTTLGNIRIARNFLHHNMRNEGGYVASVRGRALIERNTFAWNRHDISADAEPHNEYHASHNLIMSGAPTYTFGPISGWRLQDFDMHGTGGVTYCLPFDIKCLDGQYFGGAGGYYVEIVGNTFLGGNGHDYWLRGYPVFNTDYHRNASLRNKGDAVQFESCEPDTVCFSTDFPINVFDSQFADSSPPYTDPTTRRGPASLGVGDFDGDGDDDLFLATGNTWFYSPAGAREWRYLNSAPDTIDQLLFGDFDGDGRTDVVAMRNGQLVVSWGGISAFDVLNYGPLPCSSMSDMAVGDSDGDGHPDIFCADGTTWWVSFGGNTSFVQVQASSYRVANLSFGDFNGDGTTDVLGVVSYGATNYLQVSYSPKLAPGTWFSGWTPLQPALTNSVSRFMIADFNGDGIADVLAPSSDGWQISYGGSQPWTDVPQPFFAGSSGNFAFLDVAAVGHFTGQRQADILVWNGTPYIPLSTGVTELLLSAAGVSPATAYSTQDMR